MNKIAWNAHFMPHLKMEDVLWDLIWLKGVTVTIATENVTTVIIVIVPIVVEVAILINVTQGLKSNIVEFVKLSIIEMITMDYAQNMMELGIMPGVIKSNILC